MTHDKQPPSRKADNEPLDIHAHLAERGEIAIIWCIEDVQSVRPDLTSEQAWEVLLRCRDKHDCEWGFTWSYLRDVAALLYPESDSDREEEPA